MPVRVAILGAGPAGLAAAWRLSDPVLEGAFDVTIYQVGWRAGGLCATGRVGAVPPVQDYERIGVRMGPDTDTPDWWINQNGTHYLFGCYHQSLGLLRDAYTVLEEHDDHRFGTFEQQLIPRDAIVLKQLFRGQWTDWTFTWPTNDRPIGTRPEAVSTEQLLVNLIEWLVKKIATGTEYELDSVLEHPIRTVARLVSDLVQGVDYLLATERSLRLLRELRANITETLGESEVSLEALRFAMLLDLGLTMAIGMLTDKPWTPEGQAYMNTLDFREWLRIHGGHNISVWSPIVTTWYDAIASYARGDIRTPQVAAGASLTCILELVLDYSGSIAYQLSWEVGDSVIAPIYQALRYRGVKFAFFHRVWDIVPDPNGIIRSVVMERQVEVKGGPFAYEPLVPYPFDGNPQWEGRLCWPDTPRWDQLIDPDPSFPPYDNFYRPATGASVEIEAGKDFDLLIGAMGNVIYRYVGKRLAIDSPRWQKILQLPTLETQSLRIWFKPDLEGLGWTGPAPILSAYALPYATWEDPTPCLESEIWVGQGTPQTLSHLFGPLSTPETWPDPIDVQDGLNFLALQQQRTEQEADNWMAYNIGSLWYKATHPGWPQSLDMEYVSMIQIRANSGPFEAYTQVLPNTIADRPRPDESEYSNFLLCGDWVWNHLQTGSVEGAILTGEAVANIVIERYR